MIGRSLVVRLVSCVVPVVVLAGAAGCDFDVQVNPGPALLGQDVPESTRPPTYQPAVVQPDRDDPAGMPGGAEMPSAPTSGPHMATQWPKPPRKPVRSAIGSDASIGGLLGGLEREARA